MYVEFRDTLYIETLLEKIRYVDTLQEAQAHLSARGLEYGSIFALYAVDNHYLNVLHQK